MLEPPKAAATSSHVKMRRIDGQSAGNPEGQPISP